MIDGWPIRALGEVCDFTRGLTYSKADEVTSSSNVVLRASNIDLQTGRLDLSDLRYIKDDVPIPEAKKVLRNSLLICTASGSRSHLGKVAFVDQDVEAAFGGFMGQIVPRSAVDPRFLFHLLMSPRFKEHLLSLTGGTNINNLRLGDVAMFTFPMPPLPEQKRIASVLDEAIEQLEDAEHQVRQSLDKTRQVLLSHLGELFTHEAVTWRNTTVGAVADHVLGKMLDKAKNRGAPKPYLRNQNVRWFRFDLDDVAEMRFEETEVDRYSARAGDVLICEGGYPGRSAVWMSDEPIFIQKAIHRVRFDQPAYGLFFNYYLFYLHSTGRLSPYLTGTGIQHFTGQSLARLPICLPPLDTAREIVERIRAVHRGTDSLATLLWRKLELVAELKQSLRTRAFSGDLTREPIAA